MKLTFRFLDKEEWSIYATINVAIILLLFLVTRQKINVQSLVFMSLLGMMEGPLLEKIIFTGFLNFLVYEPSNNWIIRSIIYIISIILISYIPYNNIVQETIENNMVFLNIFRGIVGVWMVYILYRIIYPIIKWKK
jgi:hypothetical protein